MSEQLAELQEQARHRRPSHPPKPLTLPLLAKTIRWFFEQSLCQQQPWFENMVANKMTRLE
jgi:hypothetical protein